MPIPEVVRQASGLVADVIRHCRVPQGAAVLELGIGGGEVARALTGHLNRLADYLGLDFDGSAVEACRREIGTTRRNFRFHSIRELKQDLARLPNAYFDCVIASEMFARCTLEDIALCLPEVARVLKPDGRAYLNFFVVDEHYHWWAERSGSAPIRAAGGGIWKHRPQAPEFTGFEQHTLLLQMLHAGLSVVGQGHGSWAEKPEAESYYDWRVVERFAAEEPQDFDSRAVRQLEGLRLTLERLEGEAKFESVMLHAPLIEAGTPKRHLAPWFDVRGTVQFLREVFTSSELAQFTRQHPEFRAAGIAYACDRLDAGAAAEALEPLERALASRSEDLFVQELLAEAHLAISGGQSRGGQAPPEHWQGRYCPHPFVHFEPLDKGDTHICCALQAPIPIGNIFHQPLDRLWNSFEAREIRASILDGSFRYCSKLHCPRLLAGDLPKIDEVVPLGVWVDEPPSELVLNYDRSCNLSCPSCRKGLIAATPEQRSVFDRIRPQMVELVNRSKKTHFTAAGDPFASAHFRKILQEIRPDPEMVLAIQTNGLLFTEKEWSRLQHLHHLETWVEVSQDALTPELYRELRRGGELETLTRNLRYISSLRQAGALARFHLVMVVQQANYRQMPDFVSWAEELAADQVIFFRLRNWGTYTPEDFLARDVGAPSHPEYPEFLRILQDPRMQSPLIRDGSLPVVEDLSSLAMSLRVDSPLVQIEIPA